MSRTTTVSLTCLRWAPVAPVLGRRRSLAALSSPAARRTSSPAARRTSSRAIRVLAGRPLHLSYLCPRQQPLFAPTVWSLSAPAAPIHTGHPSCYSWWRGGRGEGIPRSSRSNGSSNPSAKDLSSPTSRELSSTEFNWYGFGCLCSN